MSKKTRYYKISERQLIDYMVALYLWEEFQGECFPSLMQRRDALFNATEGLWDFELLEN